MFKKLLQKSKIYDILNVGNAGVMELADVLDSKSSPGNRVRVRPPPPAPKKLPKSCGFGSF